MLTTFECPSCGAPLQYGGGPTQFCTYCQSTVIAPQRQQPFRQQPFQVNGVYQQRAVVDLRPYTRNSRGGMNRGLKWGLGIFVFVMLVSTLAPVLMALFGILLSVVMAFLQV